MNKKNTLLTLALPLLVLSACGGGEDASSLASSLSENSEISSSEESKENSSSSDETSSSSVVSSEDSSSIDSAEENPSSESLSPDYSSYKVDENVWKNTLGSVNSLMSISASEEEGGTSFVYTYFDEDATKVVESFRKDEEDLAKKKSETIYGKSVDGSYERYTYQEDSSSYMVETLSGESPFWTGKEALFSLLSSSYSSFDFVESSNGYFASSLTSSQGDIRVKNVRACFDDGAIFSLSFVLLDEEGEALSHTTITDINCTYVDLPSQNTVNEGLVGAEGWDACFASMGAKRNATLLYTDGLNSLDSSLKTICGYVYDGNKAHVGISVNSSSESEDPNISAIKTNIEKDVYYSVEGEKAYSYEKMSNQDKYEKTLLPSLSLPSWTEFDALVSTLLSSFSSFAYDEASGSFKADSLPSNGNFTYQNVEVRFSYGKLSSISYGNGSISYSVSDIGSSEVILPSEDKVYIPGKVSKEDWENMLLEAATSLNCQYQVSYSYDDEYNSYYLETISNVDGDKMESTSRYEDHKDTSNNYNDHCYYSKENGTSYKLSESEDWYVKEACSDPFKEIEEAILLFADYYDSFNFSEPQALMSGCYSVPSLTIEEKTYTNVCLSFGNNLPGRISYRLGDYDYLIQSFTCMEVTLPEDTEVYYEGKVKEAAWKSAMEGAGESLNFKLKKDSSDDASSILSESVYLCDQNAIEYTYEEVSDSSSKSEHSYYSLEDSSYYAYEAKGDYWTKTKDTEENPASSSCFAAMKECVASFENHYSDFSFDQEKGAYVCSSLNGDDSNAYSDIAISFDGDSLSKIEYTLNSETYVIDAFGEQEVTVPSSDELYEEGKVKKEIWENAFLEAATSPNFSYSYNVEGKVDGVYSSTDYLIKIDGDKIEKSTSANGQATSTVYEGKEGDVYYLYSQSDSTWNKEESETAKADFEDVDTAIMRFSESYDDFSYDSRYKRYIANNLTVDGTIYQEVWVTFEDGKLASVRWSLDMSATRTIDGFGKATVALPSVKE